MSRGSPQRPRARGTRSKLGSDDEALRATLSVAFAEIDKQFAAEISRNRADLAECLSVQQDALAEIDDELRRARRLLDENPRTQRETAPGKPQEKLSPLAVAVVIDERNTLRQQLREAAAQLVRTQRLWEIELGAARASARIEAVQQFPREVQRLKPMIDAALVAKDEDFHRQDMVIEELHQEIKRTRLDAEAQASRAALALAAKESEIGGLEKQVLDLETECDAIRVEAREHLEKQLAELEAKMDAKFAAHTNDGVDEALVEAKAEAEARLERELEALRSRLTAKFEEEKKIELSTQRIELQNIAKINQERAVEEVIDHFKKSKVLPLEEQRARIEAQHQNELVATLRRVNEQQGELELLRESERELMLGPEQDCPEHDWARTKLEQSQRLRRAPTGSARPFTAPTEPVGVEPTPFLMTKTLDKARLGRSGSQTPATER